MPSAEPPAGLTGTEEWAHEVADGGEPAPIQDSRMRFSGRIWGVRSDRITVLGHEVERDILVHPGAVAVIALDKDDRVLLIRQYRHPVGLWLFEPPAGLLDEPGEDPFATARRELAEEAGLQGERWHVLADLLTSPGGSSEAIRIYLARGLSELPEGRMLTAEAEESHLPRAWVGLDDAVALVLGGRVQSPTAVSGVLAAAAARDGGWSALRPPDAPWPMREHLIRAARLHRPAGLRSQDMEHGG